MYERIHGAHRSRIPSGENKVRGRFPLSPGVARRAMHARARVGRARPQSPKAPTRRCGTARATVQGRRVPPSAAPAVRTGGWAARSGWIGLHPALGLAHAHVRRPHHMPIVAATLCATRLHRHCVPAPAAYCRLCRRPKPTARRDNIPRAIQQQLLIRESATPLLLSLEWWRCGVDSVRRGVVAAA